MCESEGQDPKFFVICESEGHQAMFGFKGPEGPQRKFFSNCPKNVKLCLGLKARKTSFFSVYFVIFKDLGSNPNQC